MINHTKLLSGKVSASNCNDDIALSDITAVMPKMSGGAVLRSASELKYQLGIHMGVIYHEETTQKQIKEVEQVSSSAPVEFLGENALETKSVTLFEDRIVLIKPAVVKNDQSIASPCKEVIPEINALSIVGSPPENIRSRVLYAMENKPQEGSMTYFLPKRTLVAYLNLCDASKKRGLKRSLTTQTS